MSTSRILLNLALGVGTLMLVQAGSVSQARADGAWCAEAGGRNSYSNCGYHTFAQCLAAISGVGGNCSPNPNAVAYEPPYRVQRIYR